MPEIRREDLTRLMYDGHAFVERDILEHVVLEVLHEAGPHRLSSLIEPVRRAARKNVVGVFIRDAVKQLERTGRVEYSPPKRDPLITLVDPSAVPGG